MQAPGSLGLTMLAVCLGVAMPARPVTLRSDVQTLLRAGIHVSVVLGPDETFDKTIEGPAEGTQDSIEAFGLRWGPVLEVSSEGRRVTITADPRLLARFDGKALAWRIAEGTHRIVLGPDAQTVAASADVRLRGRTFAR